MEDICSQSSVDRQIERERERDKYKTFPLMNPTDLPRIHNAKIKYITGIHALRNPL
jgi:hypothetical protein